MTFEKPTAHQLANPGFYAALVVSDCIQPVLERGNFVKVEQQLSKFHLPHHEPIVSILVRDVGFEVMRWPVEWGEVLSEPIGPECLANDNGCNRPTSVV
jgi:hypothetical protein